jgi:hypothetical protein
VGFPKAKADELFEAWKRLSPPSRWALKENNSGRETGRELECLVEIDGGIWRGAAFLIVISAGHLDKCTMSLLVRHDDSRIRYPIYRLDVNPTMPHRNPFCGPMDLQGQRFQPGDTHEHVYFDNLDETGTLFDRCGSVARPIVKAPSNFQEALDYIRDRLHLLNTEDIPSPETQGDLL